MTESTVPTYEVVLSRYFDAPPELVYRAFVDPEQLVQWFAPLAFHVPFESVEVDARVGGRWKLDMVSNVDPTQIAPMETVFTEVIENRLLVGYETAVHVPGLAHGEKLTLSIEFFPEGDGTRLELREGPLPAQMREMAEVGWTQALYKLTALLATPAKYRNAPRPEEASS